MLCLHSLKPVARLGSQLSMGLLRCFLKIFLKNSGIQGVFKIWKQKHVAFMAMILWRRVSLSFAGIFFLETQIWGRGEVRRCSVGLLQSGKNKVCPEEIAES